MSEAEPAHRSEMLSLVVDDDPVELTLDDESSASPEIMDVAGSLLEKRARTEKDLTGRLAGRGYAASEVEAAMESLKRLGLVDDNAFALTWLESRKGAKAMGRSGLVAKLEHKGLEREAAEAAIEASGHDEHARALEFARGNLRRLSGLSPARQAAKMQRMLSHRGFEEEAMEDAIKAILPPEGWD
jgi:regulatory protein